MPRVKGDYSGPERRCNGPCGLMLLWSSFGIDRDGTNGYKSWCKSCEHDRNVSPESVRAQREYRVRANRECPWKKLWSASRQRSHEHTITLEDIKTVFLNCNGVCPVIGCGRSFSPSGTHDDRYASPSLDRIDNSLGYVPGNIWIICFECNHIKRHYSADRLAGLAESIRLAKK